jgi:aquaporin Z
MADNVADNVTDSVTDSEWTFPWMSFWAEFAGTALLVMGGLSLVIVLFGSGTPLAGFLPGEAATRAISGFLFGALGASIALSIIGKQSGAHINPVVTMVFWLAGRLDYRTALVFAVAQLAGAAVGSLPLLLWGSMGESIAFGATRPGSNYSTTAALLGEIATTGAMVSGLCVFLAIRSIRRFTPAMFPFLYAIMVPLEASISGTSTNPARSFGPSMVSGEWSGWWIYWIGPAVGAFLGLLLCIRLKKRIEVAKLYHFDSTPTGRIHKIAHRSGRGG